MMKTSVIWQKPDSWRFEVGSATLPDGRVVERAQIRHPGAVVLVPLTADNQLLMLRQYRVAIAQTILELPAGTRGWDEDWELCAQRELREEAGYRAGKLTPLGDIWPAPGASDELMRLYLMQDLTADPLPQDDDEWLEVVPMPLVDLVAMAFDGRVQDGKSVVGILRTARLLGLV
ncbi:MAG: NUDIX hydrolase [Anaerolineales bacterium]|nr:NUDIX hydrolase [Anaerolineales bacterium]